VEAEDFLRAATAANPESPEAHNNLGEALRRVGRLDEAGALLARAMMLRPNYAQAARNLAKVVAQLDHAGLMRLGNQFVLDGQFDAAGECFRRAAEQRPDDVAAVFNYGGALEMQGLTADAVRQYDRARQLRPRDATRLLSATRMPVLYDSPDDLLSWRRRLRENLDAFARDNFRLDITRHAAPELFRLPYQGLEDRDIMRDYCGLLVPPPDPPIQRRDPRDERIHVGFISLNLYNHTIGRINRGLIEQLDREKFHVTVFKIDRHDDPESRQIRAAADEYIEVSPRDLPEARQRIASRGVDVLFYTDIGMENITLTLAQSRLAPVQAVTWGHPPTTGSPVIDYYVSSELLESADAQAHYTERLIKLANLSVYYYRPPTPPPFDVRAAFGGSDVHVYGCLQNLFKLHPDFDAILDDILLRDPRGVILLPHGHTRHWDDALMHRLSRTMPQTVSRVRFFDVLPYEQYLGLTAACDVLLAPIHFGAGNTSYEAMAFGTPTVTMPSPFLKGRITHGLYRAMGVMDCVAETPQAYAELAVRLGTDRDFNRAVRGKILANNHVLYENPAGVRDLEQFFIDAVHAARR
jgi:predicted O-linked N-acetylglucosamine transferase (SPINDLY family)